MEKSKEKMESCDVSSKAELIVSGTGDRMCHDGSCMILNARHSSVHQHERPRSSSWCMKASKSTPDSDRASVLIVHVMGFAIFVHVLLCPF
jgi:hypothetical protein